MEVPTVKEIRVWSKVDFDSLEYEQATPDPLDIVVARAREYVEDTTGRTYADMPTEFELTAGEALQRRTEQAVFKAQEDEAETGADFELIKSFGAASYNETRRDMGEMLKAKQVNPWPLLHDLLWRMMTQAKKEEWEALFGLIVPGFEVTEVDWHGTLLAPSITDRWSI